jgi:membrane protease YdiL (CAAX protease family)
MKSRCSILWPLFSITAGSDDGHFAFFGGMPYTLKTFDPRDGQVKALRPWRGLVADLKVKGLKSGDIRSFQVLDWRKGRVLCKADCGYIGTREDRGVLLFVVDEKTGKATFAARTRSTLAKTMSCDACLTDDGRVIYVSDGRFWAVRAGTKPLPFASELTAADRAVRGTAGPILLTADRHGKSMKCFLLDSRTLTQAKFVTTSKVYGYLGVSPSGEIFCTDAGQVRMIYPKKLDLGPGLWPAIGGTAQRTEIWAWDNDHGNRISRWSVQGGKVAAVDHFALRADRKYLAQTDWRSFGGMLLRSALVLTLAVVLTILILKRLKMRAKYLGAVIVLFVGYWIASAAGIWGWLSLVWTFGVAPGMIVTVDVFVVLSLYLLSRLSRQSEDFGLPNGFWGVSLSPLAWSAVAFLLVWVIARAFTAPDGLQRAEMSYLAVLIPCQIAIVATWEEIIFRGLLWRQFTAWRMPVFVIILLQALVFAAPHLYPWARIDRSLVPPITGYILVGILLGVARWRSKSLLPGVVGHALFNILVITLFSPTPWIMKMFG